MWRGCELEGCGRRCLAPRATHSLQLVVFDSNSAVSSVPTAPPLKTLKTLKTLVFQNVDTAGSNLFSSHSKFCHGHFSAKWGGADIYIRCYPLRLPLIRGDLDIYLFVHLLSRDSYIRCWLTARRFLKALLGKQNKAWLEGTCSFCQTLYVCLSWSPSKKHHK